MATEITSLERNEPGGHGAAQKALLPGDVAVHLENFKAAVLIRLKNARLADTPQAWADLASSRVNSHDCYSALCRELVTGSKGLQWYPALQALGASEEEVAKIKKACHLESMRSAGAKLCRYTASELHTWFEESIIPLLKAARSIPGDTAWTALGRPTMERDPHYYAACFQFDRHGRNWYEVLKYLGATTEEVTAIQRAIRRTNGAARESKFSNAVLDEWFTREVLPLIESARTAGSWDTVAHARFKEAPLFSPFCLRYSAQHNPIDWYGALQARGVSSVEIEAIRAAAVDTSRAKIAQSRQKYSDQVLLRWLKNEVVPLVEEARKCATCEAWGRVAYANFDQDSHFSSFCYRFSPKNCSSDWYGALIALKVIAASEERVIRIARRAMLADKGRASIVAEQFFGQPEESVLATIRADEIIPISRPPATGLRVVLDSANEAIPTEAQLYRLLVGSKLCNNDWNDLASLYERVFPNLQCTLTTKAGLRFIYHLAETGVLPLGAPKKILSVASGIGSLYRCVQEASSIFTRLNIAAPEVADLDSSAHMLARSPNPKKILADAALLPAQPGEYDAIECSSTLVLKPDTLKRFVLEASRVLPRGGLLWLKVDGAFFADSFQDAIESAGFNLVAPLNVSLGAVVEKDDLRIHSAVSRALTRGHFLLAIKEHDLAECNISEQSLVFRRGPKFGEELKVIREQVRALKGTLTDEKNISLAADFEAYLAALPAALVQEQAWPIAAVCYLHARRLYYRSELPTFPIAAQRSADSFSLLMKEIDDRLNYDLSSLESLPENDSVRRLLVTLLHIVENVRPRNVN